MDALEARGRRAARLLPPPVRGILRRIYVTVRTPRRPPDPAVALAADVADRAALIDYLRDTDLFGEAEAERDNYLSDAIERFQITLSLVDRVLTQGRVLELGSNPYFITRLLRRRRFDVTCANWFGDSGGGARGTQVVTAPRGGERHVFEFDHFNVETDAFPYPDGSFDLVLCCEILEHLPHDPVHMLAEIHRVLRKPTGHLLLTTPNPVRMDNLTRMLNGDNVYEQLSGYGPYGRHNREYTVDELSRLLDACGYVDLDVFATDIHSVTSDPGTLRAAVNLRDRGDNLFALARSDGDERWPYPTWLYSSQHALARRVRPDVRIGYNDDLQSSGMHDSERDGPRFSRWTAATPARLLLSAGSPGPATLRVEGEAPPASAGDGIQLCAEVNGRKVDWAIWCDGRPFAVTAQVETEGGDVDVVLTTDRTWRPCDVMASADDRSLGVRIARVSIG